MKSLYVLSVFNDPGLARLVSRLMRSVGIKGKQISSGQQALESYATTPFGLVLVDSQLEDMSGIALVEALRKLQEHSGWQPIIMISASDRVDTQIAALNAGCDDVITRPINLRILNARIASFRRTARMQEDIARQHRQLCDYRHKEIEEKRISSFLVNRLTRHDLLEREPLDYLLQPAEDVSGDLLLACRANNGDLYVMLADASGHGLPAALTLIPLSQTFYAMAIKGFSIGSIARSLNRKNREYSPSDRFVAALLALYSPLDGTLAIWNGGVPAALLLNENGEVIRRFRSQNLPLGIVGDEAFTSESETHQFQSPCQLFIHSDGLIEAEAPDGEPFGQHRLEQALRGCLPSQRVEQLRDQVTLHRRGRPAHDDISCLQLYCQPATLRLSKLGEAQRPADRWGLKLELTTYQLRELDLEPLISAFCQGLGLETSRHGVFSLILRELLSNAIDHGLLQLDSSIKNQPDGFDRFMQLREQALRQLQSGEIGVSISQDCVGGENRLTIQVRDTGKGFDYQAYTCPNNALDYHGRGLFLVRRLCSKLTFHGPGNKVTAELSWRQEQHNEQVSA